MALVGGRGHGVSCGQLAVALRPHRGDVAGHPGQLVVIAAGPVLQRGGQRPEPLVDSCRTELRRTGDRAVGQLQPARLTGPDVDGGQHDDRLGAADLTAPPNGAPRRPRANCSAASRRPPLELQARGYTSSS